MARPLPIPAAYDPEIDSPRLTSRSAQVALRFLGWLALSFWLGGQITSVYIVPAAVKSVMVFMPTLPYPDWQQRSAIRFFTSVEDRVSAVSFGCAFILLLATLREAHAAFGNRFIRYMPFLLTIASLACTAACFYVRLGSFGPYGASFQSSLATYFHILDVQIVLLCLVALSLVWLQTSPNRLQISQEPGR